MKKLILVTSSISLLFLSACANLQPAATIKEGHFRFENFYMAHKNPNELVFLACFRKKKSEWIQARQFEAGEHDLWVSAVTQLPSVKNSKKSVYLNFKVKLEANKNYRLNSTRNEGDISVWIENKETGEMVTEVQTGELRPDLFTDVREQYKNCRAGTV